MNIVTLLTGRGNNTLKDKNVLPVLGRPLLYYPAIAAKKSKHVTHLYVSSDDSKILEAAAEIGYRTIVRPKELALPDSQHVDTIRHAVEIMKNDGIAPDILVVVLANNGIIKTDWIDECIEMILANATVSATVPVVEDTDHHPYRAKKLEANGFLGTFFNFSGEKISTNRQDLVKSYFLCHNFWVLNVKESLTDEGQAPWTFMGDKIKPLVIEESFDVHTMEDIAKTEKWILENITF
ncbi:cytidylyltransferase domain-containing protein [Parasediminibacterium sp. JCM 36343]|uniref:acylneuraminate cytidylyltransferase family protein n=1 Tax=Parasediminibacterium sp. JCM 36343 TaxID=3374279 RepID=UPI00397B43A0